MSQTFRIIPREKRARKAVERLSVKEFVAYMDGNFDYLPDLIYKGHQYMSEEAEWAQRISKETISYGREQFTCRGFSMYYEKKSFCVRINTPATTKDWQTALAFIKQLATKTDATVMTETGKELSLDTIEGYDYKTDILAGIKNLEQVHGSDMQAIAGPCDRLIYLDETMAQSITTAADPIAAFDTTLEKVFHTDAATPRQYFIPFRKQDGSDEFLIGYHILFTDIPTILPIKPILYQKNVPLIRPRFGGIQKWFIALNIPGEDPDLFAHEDIIEHLQRCWKIDANQLYVEAMPREEMLELAKKCE